MPPPPPDRWSNRNGGPTQQLGGPSFEEREGKGSEWRSANRRRRLQIENNRSKATCQTHPPTPNHDRVLGLRRRSVQRAVCPPHSIAHSALRTNAPPNNPNTRALTPRRGPGMVWRVWPAEPSDPIRTQSPLHCRRAVQLRHSYGHKGWWGSHTQSAAKCWLLPAASGPQWGFSRRDSENQKSGNREFFSENLPP